MKVNLPEQPVDEFEVRYFTIRSRRVQELRLLYHVNKKWDGTRGGVDFVDDWQVFVDGYFSGRMGGWLTPSSQGERECDFATRDEAVSALKQLLEGLAQQADERAREYREQAEQI